MLPILQGSPTLRSTVPFPGHHIPHARAPLQRSSSRWSSCPGFTMIELLVAITLFSIVIGIVVQALSTGLQGTSKATVVRDAQEYALRTTEALQADVRSLRAHDRNAMSIREPQSLQGWVQHGEPQLHAATRRPLDLVEVHAATPTRFAFRADVSQRLSPVPGQAECVTYDLTTTGQGTELARYVSGYGGACPSTTGERTVLIPRRPRPAWLEDGAGPGFEYDLMCSVNTCPGFAAFPLKTPGDTNHCAVRRASTVTGTARNWIVAVGFRFSAPASRGGSTQEAVSEASSVASIRTRLQHDYLFALGCENRAT